MFTLGFAIYKLAAAGAEKRKDVASAISFIALGITAIFFGTIRYYRVRFHLKDLVKDANLFSMKRLGTIRCQSF